MRVEPVPAVYHAGDRGERRADDSGDPSERRQSNRRDRRARHAARPWLAAEFGAHLLGQGAPLPPAAPAAVDRAYRQPESRTPPRPRNVKLA